MGIFINTNVAAINAQRHLGTNAVRLGRALEQLSSGLRINRAADDAAGLAISEKMRAQIRGLRQGARNAQDAVSMIQTAEGALNEVHAILQRMRELAVQAGNSTLAASDRTAVGEELLTLRTEVDNIASRTTFNGLKLLTGALSLGTASTIADLDPGDGNMITFAIDVSAAAPSTTYTISRRGSDLTLDAGGVSQTLAVADMSANEVQVLDFDAFGVKIAVTTGATGDSDRDIATQIDTLAAVVTDPGDGRAVFQVGANVGDTVAVAFADMQSAMLGDAANPLSAITDNGAADSVAKANALLGSLDIAVRQVSTQRAKLGAAQNQMGVAINSIGVAVENLAAAESRIRDADIAQVATELVTRQILQEAGTAVLAQASASTRSVLALLQ